MVYLRAGAFLGWPFRPNAVPGRLRWAVPIANRGEPVGLNTLQAGNPFLIQRNASETGVSGNHCAGGLGLVESRPLCVLGTF